MAKQKTFTLNEAQTLLPVLNSVLTRAMQGKAKIELMEQEFQKIKYRIMLTGGLLLEMTDMARRKAEQDKALQEIKDALAEIGAIGVQVKDLDIGLLDFPCVVENEIVLLCWKYGEEKIEFWHGVEEGFAGRKPIDERITGKKKEKPN
ncbi:MAG TPA: DUF2203 domain-containing protein [Terriglobales bacterium]|jgi:hypothetical protein|nr:DUF2203 domain-containing protein [Terriglobales bacterium]